jgi:Rrf2 family protein
MLLSQKTQYALRAIFEIARRNTPKPVPLSSVAKVQAIPLRFLEVIMGQLRQAGFVVSRRGKRGGYILARSPAEITIGAIIVFLEGDLDVVDCIVGKGHERCPLFGETCVFLPIWQRANQAISDVFDQTTFQDLLDRDQGTKSAPNYTI